MKFIMKDDLKPRFNNISEKERKNGIRSEIYELILMVAMEYEDWYVYEQSLSFEELEYTSCKSLLIFIISSHEHKNPSFFPTPTQLK